MFNIAIAGLGTVGAGVARLLQTNAALISVRAGMPVKIRAVSARTKKKKRDCNLGGIEWVSDPRKLAEIPGIDAVIELIGGAEGIARQTAEAALCNGKPLVTANKALLAIHGATLARLAEKNKVQLAFEASVAGGIPIIKTMREALAGNHIAAVRGILNGTCNYILTRMEQDKLSFADALNEAQAKGYAEADPSSDIDGHDTANKLAILAALAFGTEPAIKSVQTEGIRRIAPVDLQFADELDCRVKLLGVARTDTSGHIEQRVGPFLVPKSSPLSQVSGVMNAVTLRGDFVGDLTLEGRGAGAEPTASAVVSDIIDLARGFHSRGPLFQSAKPATQKHASAASVPSRYYMRLQVLDKPGVVADISAILRDEKISIESLIQRGRATAGSVPVVLMMHETHSTAMKHAADKIARVKTVVNRPVLLPIEE